jgi:hypothetical protein
MNESPDKMRSPHPFTVFYLIAVISCFLSTPAFAATCAGVPSLTQLSQLDFSTLQIPAATATLTIAPSSGSATSGTGALLYGAASSGRFSISSGSSSQKNCKKITINVTGTGCGVSGCTLGSWTGKYGTTTLSGPPPWTGLAMPGSGNTLYLGTTATYNSSVRAGTYAPVFTISVNYDSETPTNFPQIGAVAFDLPLSIDTLSDISFGHVEAKAEASYTIDTAGNLTATGSGQWINGPTSAGRLLIHGSATQTISISADSYVASGTGNGVKLSSATCSYNSGAPKPCSLTTQTPPGAAGKILLLGATVKVNNKQPDGSTATPSFTITVTYT